jgi:hypothetical protein
MRKLGLLLLFVLMLFTLPGSAGAASEHMALENLTIQLWPDYDQLNVLVIYDFTLDAKTTLPATVHFQMPSNADLVAVAKNSDGGLLTVEHNLLAAQGDTSAVTFTVTDQTSYHLEYYLPYMLEGQVRNFVFTWPGDYAVKSFNLALQQPSAATNITTDPPLKDIPSDKNGFAYQATTPLELAAQQTFILKVQYENDSNMLSASTLSVQPSSPLTENVPGQVSLMTYVPWILAGLAVVLILGGIGWYWFSSKSHIGSVKPAQNRSAREKSADAPGQERQVYCHQCGKRAQADDRFCRTCGAELRQGEM